MAEVGSDFGEGREGESTPGERGMREGEAGRVEDQVVDEEKVEVEGARMVGQVAAPIAAVTALGGEQEIEEGVGRECSFKCNSGVYKCGLVREADRFGAVERGAGEDVAFGGEVADGGGDGLLGRACGRVKIRAEPDGGKVIHRAQHYANFEGDADARYAQKQ